MLADSCVNSSGRGYHVKYAEQGLEYMSLCTVVQRIWDMKCTIILVLEPLEV